MKKIAIVVPNYEESAGVRTVTNFIYDAVKQAGYNAHIFSLATSYRDENSTRLLSPGTWFKNPVLSTYQQNGQKITRAGCRWPEIETNRYQPRELLTRELNKFDLIQVVAGTPAWANVCKNCTKPVALQVATLTSIEREERLKSYKGLVGTWKKRMTRIISSMDKEGFRIADAIMVENYWMKDLLEESGYGSKTYFAPPGVDTNIFNPGESTEVDPNPYILSVARFSDPRKDVKTLFKAYRKLLEMNDNTPRLILAGKKMPRKEDMDLAEKLAIRDNIILKENISLDELVDLYRGAELFVLSSREEGLGMVIMEAMACGTPVVSTDCGGPRTLIEDGINGFLSEVGDEDQLALNMNRVLSDGEIKDNFIRNSQQKIKSTFALEEAINNYIKIYETVL